MNWKVPLSDVKFDEHEFSAVQAVLESGWLTMGSVTQAFEQEFCGYTGARYAFAVNSATAALHLVCQAIGLGPGDEVIVPSLSFVATANAVRYTGATPIFADIIGETDLTISSTAIERAITPRTKAIIVMHYGGYACDMPRIMALARAHHLAVIEDAAHAIGASLDNHPLGAWGIAGCYSFFSNKNMTTGEGGMLVTNDDLIADQVRVLRSHGMTSPTWDRYLGHAWSYDVVGLGYNYRIDEIRSALGREQLKKLDGSNARRREITGLYRHLLADLVPAIGVPFNEHPGISAHHLMPVLLPEGADRLKFMDGMKAQGIQTSIHYPPIHRFTSFRNEAASGSSLPVTEAVARREVTLPLYPLLTGAQVESVVLAARQALAEK